MSKPFRQVEPLDDTGAQDAEGVGLEIVGELIELTNTGISWPRAGAELVHAWLTAALGIDGGGFMVTREWIERMDAETDCDCGAVAKAAGHQTHCWKFDLLAAVAAAPEAPK